MNHSRYSLCARLCTYVCARQRLCLFQKTLLKGNLGGWKKGLEKKGITLEVATQEQIYETINLFLCLFPPQPPLSSSSFFFHLPLFFSHLLFFSSRALLCIYFINPTLLSFSLAHSNSIYFFHFTSPNCALLPPSYLPPPPLSLFVSIMTCLHSSLLPFAMSIFHCYRPPFDLISFFV